MSTFELPLLHGLRRQHSGGRPGGRRPTAARRRHRRRLAAEEGEHRAVDARPTAETEGALEDLTEGEPVRDADDAAKWDFAFN